MAGSQQSALACRDAISADSREVVEFVNRHPCGRIEHTLEGSGLAALDSHWKWRSALCVCRRAGAVAGVLPYAIARAGKLPLALCRSEGGPLVGPGDSEALDAMLSYLERQARAGRACRIEMQSLYPLTIDGAADPAGAAMLRGLEAHGFARDESSHYGTYYVPLTDDAAMEAAISSPCRRKLRKGLRDGVTVACRTDPAAIDEFIPIYLDMCRRKELRPRGREYLRGIAACLRVGTAAVFVASYQGKPCNLALVATTGGPVYWLGGMSSDALADNVPHTGQALHFAAMRHLHALGRAFYDFGGSPGAVPKAGHPNYGVWKFKHEFNPRYVECIDRLQRILNPAGNMLMEQTHRLIRFVVH